MKRLKDFLISFEPAVNVDSNAIWKELRFWHQTKKPDLMTYTQITRIKSLRKRLTEQTNKTIILTHKPTKFSEKFKVNNKMSIAKQILEGLLPEFIKRVHLYRESKKHVSIQPRNGMGVGYCLTGGVHLTPGSILEIGRKSPLNNIDGYKTPRTEKNYIGIELEFNDAPGITPAMIKHKITELGLAKFCNLTRDSSCGHELRVLVPELGFEETLRKIMVALAEMGHSCDHRCGGHVHFDMRKRDVKKVYTNLVRSLNVLKKLVKKDRLTNKYCKANPTDDFDTCYGQGERYHMINARSYSSHQTLEVRLHHGTLDPDEMINWIKFLLKIVNYSGEIDKHVLYGKSLYRYIDFNEDEKQMLKKRYVQFNMRTSLLERLRA